MAVVVRIIRPKEGAHNALWIGVLCVGKASDGRRTPLHGNSHYIEVFEICTHLLENCGGVVTKSIGNKTLLTHPTDGDVSLELTIRNWDNLSARNIHMLPLALLAVSAKISGKRRLGTLN